MGGTSDERLAEPERLAAAADLPWSHEADDEPPGDGVESANGGAICHMVAHGNVNTAARAGEWSSRDQARYLVAAANGVPGLVAEVRRLREELAAERERCEKIADGWADTNAGRAIAQDIREGRLAGLPPIGRTSTVPG